MIRIEGRAAAAHLLNRLAFGPRPGDIDGLLDIGVERHVDEELSASFPDPDIDLAMRRNHGVNYGVSEIVLLHQRDNGSRASIECVLDDLRTAKLQRAVAAKNQLGEVLTDFWYNHFNVYAYAWEPSVPVYERETIRPHVFGKFGDLLRGVAKSPAMTYFLDTYVSTANRTINGRLLKGVNENYGRELLELHTVGVTAGYTQHDVYDAARCFTGWDFGGWQAPVYEYRFAHDHHDNDAKSIFGLSIAPGGGESDGDRLIQYLSTHPRTAHFISWRLAQRFVDDAPPESIVQKCAATFLETEGDIRAVLRTMFMSDEFWSHERFRSKLKTPLEFVASAIRATDGSVNDGKVVAMLVGKMGMPLYECKPPTGWSNRGTDWVNVSGQLYRFNLATALAAGELAGVVAGTSQGAESPRNITRHFAMHILGDDVGEPTRRAIMRLQMGGAVARSTKAMALLLASPEFQYR